MLIKGAWHTFHSQISTLLIIEVWHAFSSYVLLSMELTSDNVSSYVGRIS